MEKTKQEVESAKELIKKDLQERADRALRRIQLVLLEENCTLSIKPMVKIDGKEPDIITIAL